MKRSKREENLIVTYLLFYIVLFVALILFLLLKTLPDIKLIEETKANTKNVYTKLIEIEKNWLNLEEFKSMTDSSNKLTVEILSNISNKFFTENLWNKTDDSYKIFLEKLKKNLDSSENTIIMEEKSKEILNILPKYYENSLDIWGDVLTDYKFINYIELLIESFNFESNSAIWIKNLTLLEDFAVKKSAWSGLESNIFYIPLSLSLIWTKAWIIDFLYFIENVWNIKVENDNVLLSWNDTFLLKNWIPKVLEWDRLNSSYNIFEHQITDISKITMKDYMDSSYISRWEKDFKNFIVDTQWSDDFEISLELMFYVKGQPIYIIEDSINAVLDKQIKTKLALSIKLKAINKWNINYINVKKDLDTVSSYDKEVSSIRKALAKKENIEKIYTRSLKIDSVIDPINKSLNK